MEELSQSDEVDPAFETRLREINNRLRALPDELDPSVFEREQFTHATLHQIRDLMDELREDSQAQRLDTLNALLIRIEIIRHIIRDAIDEYVAGIGNDSARVIAQLREWLPRTPQRELSGSSGSTDVLFTGGRSRKAAPAATARTRCGTRSDPAP